MTVAHILKSKGRDVLTIVPHRTLAEAVAILAARRVGAVVVTGADGTVLGILSERDVVRAIGENGAEALDHAVSRHMTANVKTATEAEPVVSIMERMTGGKFRHMPVVEDGRLAGIVSIGDVVKHRLAEMEVETAAMRDYIST